MLTLTITNLSLAMSRLDNMTQTDLIIERYDSENPNTHR